MTVARSPRAACASATRRRFTPTPEGTRIDWRYKWDGGWLLLPAVGLFSRVYYRRYMRRALLVTKALVENPPHAPSAAAPA